VIAYVRLCHNEEVVRSGVLETSAATHDAFKDDSVLETSAAALDTFLEMTVSPNQVHRHSTLFQR